ncbi:neutral zinc metallopeptidase [Blastococcus sp. SYSU D00820]
MRQTVRRAVGSAAVGVVLLAGCTAGIEGTPTAARPITDVTAEEFPITGATDSEIDQYARNALADLIDFWEQAYPEHFGEPFQPLEGGIFSVNGADIDESLYPDTGIGCARQPVDPERVVMNAHYNPNCDVIAYDSALLQQLAEESDPFLGPVVMAHEFGHAMQARFGYAETSIQVETQADCLAGAFTRWVADGNAQHVSFRVPGLDAVLEAISDGRFRDPLGRDPSEEGVHGSGFDRISGFYAGYSDGVPACRDEFGPDRIFTQEEFSSDDEEDTEGNAPYEDTDDTATQTLALFYGQIFGDGFTAPEFATFDGTAPDCGDMREADRDLAYCAADNTVYADGTDLLEPVYEEFGDYAVVTAISLAYAQSVRAQLGRSTTDADATLSAVCLTGWYTGRFYSGDFDEQVASLSPGDIDEAVYLLLRYGQSESVLPGVEVSGAELVGAFRAGFLEGGGPCDIGL